MDRHKSCEDRIANELRKELEFIREALDDEEKRREYEESILAISKETVYKVERSWGGPADGFYIYVDPEDHEILRIEYYFQDWFDGATRTLTGDDFKLVAEVFGHLAYQE
jgi:hypothetical protein